MWGAFGNQLYSYAKAYDYAKKLNAQLWFVNDDWNLWIKYVYSMEIKFDRMFSVTH